MCVVDDFKNARNLMKEIQKLGYQSYMVGGCVRDFIMGKTPKDFDIASGAPTYVLEDNFKCSELGFGKLFGTVLVHYNGSAFEVTQFREDMYSEEDESRNPSTVEFVNDLHVDTARRDFTINSMAMNDNKTIIDYHGGREDIDRKLIRCVGNPMHRFKEDPLRIIRAVRFASRFDFRIEDSTFSAIKLNVKQLRRVSNERIGMEVVKAASETGESFAKFIILLKKTNLLQVIFPEVYDLIGKKHNPVYHPEGDVFNHTLKALKLYRGHDWIVNLSILLHDIGKGSAFQSVDGESYYTYHGHDKAGVDMIGEVCKRLRFSSDTKNLLEYVIKYHVIIHNPKILRKNKLFRIMDSPFWKYLIATSYYDSASREVDCFSKSEFKDNYLYSKEVYSHCVGLLRNKKKIVDGTRVVELTGLDPRSGDGPLIGKIINSATDWAVENGIDCHKKIEAYIIGYFNRMSEEMEIAS